ncbi:MAG TPA: hypothetical protein QGI40_05670 [Nitrospinaceae bacterium]|jgi:predicted negative regulator of RcsB-dependent stress response|nr:hypothetical protein [Nitrospinaceae bacterium]|tara:strand:- start:740 stop:1426 length:687 start_codon:yes stop_codon:yes gene_type:complete
MAKSVRIKRKELLNEPDQFISTTDILIAYISKHKTGVISVVTVLVLIVLAGVGIKYNQDVKNLRMESLYYAMEQARMAKESKSQEVIGKMENLLTQFSDGPQKQRATLILADELYNAHAYDRAIGLYKDIIQETSPANLPYQLASAGVAYSLEGKKDYKGAIVAYKTIIESQMGFPLFHVYLSLARCYELNKDDNGALLTLREMKTKFLGHAKIELVDFRLKKLETQA